MFKNASETKGETQDLVRAIYVLCNLATNTNVPVRAIFIYLERYLSHFLFATILSLPSQIIVRFERKNDEEKDDGKVKSYKMSFKLTEIEDK